MDVLCLTNPSLPQLAYNSTIPAVSLPSTVWVAPPAHSSSSGVVGQVAYDSSDFYICVATNTWIKCAGNISF
jgi:hypothetical protein